MAGEMLPPVVAELLLNLQPFSEGVAEAKAQGRELAASLDTSLGSMDDLAGSADAAGASLERVGATGGAAAGELDTMASGGDAAAGSLDRVAASSDAASGAQARVAESAAASRDALARTGAAGALMGSGVAKGAEDVKAAEQDAENRSSGFSSRVSSMFKGLGNTMGNFGVPFSGSVTKMGEKIDEAEHKGEGFESALMAVGKTATVVSGVALAGFAAESVHAADGFDVAQSQLQNTIKNTGASFAALSPRIDDTYGRMAKLGFNDEEVARSMTSLAIATKSPATAMRDEATAADLARAKHISLETATQTLTKVYAGSTRALTQLGLNLDIGTGKLKSIQSATESVKNAQMAYRQAQEAAAEATGSKAPEADRKLEAAHIKLQQSQLKLRMDQEAIPSILAAVQQRTEGAAHAYGDTLAGQISKADAQVHNIAVSFGEVLIPVLTHTISVVAEVVGWFAKGSPVALTLAAAIGGPLAAAMALYIARTIYAGSVTAATWVAGQFKAAASAAAQVGSWLGIRRASETTAETISGDVASVARSLSEQEAATIRLAQVTAEQTGQMEFDFQAVGREAGVMAGEVETADETIEGANATAAKSFGTVVLGIGAAIAALEIYKKLSGPGLSEHEGPYGGGTSGYKLSSSAALNGQWGVEKELAGTSMTKTAARVLEREGLGSMVTQAIIKVLESESGGGLKPTAENPKEGAYGIAQWVGPRREALEAFAKTRGSGPGEIGVQLEFLVKEMKERGELGQLKNAKSIGEAETLFVGGYGHGFERPENPAEVLARANTYGPVSAGALTGAIEHATPVVGEMSLKRAIQITDAEKAKKGVQTAIESAEAKKAAEVVKHAIETAKLKVDELKKTLSSAFGEFTKDAEKLFKMTLAKGGAKAKELEHEEAAHEEAERAKAVTDAEAGLVTVRREAAELEANARGKLTKEETALTEARQKVTDAEAKLAIAKRRGAHSAETISDEEALASAKAGVVGAEENVSGARKESEGAPAAAAAKILAAEEALNIAKYAVHVAALKKEAAAEDEKVAHENSAREAAFKAALHQLEVHLAKGKTSTNKAMHDIETLLKKYGVSFGVVGKDAGEKWVKEFEKAIKKAASDSGALSAEIQHDLSIGLKIPGLAQGGIVTSPTLAVVGENGPEAVIPLSGLSTDQPGALPSAGPAGARSVTNNFTVTNYSPEKVLPQNLQELALLLRPMLQSI